MRHANVALFVPHNGCPHQCSFCNQRSITGQQTQPAPDDVRAAALTAMRSIPCAGQAEIAFFGGSFTAIERGYMVSLLEAAAPFVQEGRFSGIRVSTRPDAVGDDILTLLKKYGVTSIELGAQSMDDRVLAINGRGHTAAQVEDAARRIHAQGFSLGLQMMTGLYGDTPAGAEYTARRLAALEPDTVRIYPTIVMRGTELEEKYRSGAYRPMALEDAVELCSRLLAFFEDRGIRVIRLGLHSTPELERGRVAGPWHPAFRELCESKRMFLRLMEILEGNQVSKGTIEIKVNPKIQSKVVGQKRANLDRLRERGYSAHVTADATLPEHTVTIAALEKDVTACF